MTKRQLQAQRNRVRQWQLKNPKKVIAASKRWKEQNPGWWKGPKLIQWLTTALINGNAKSKVFKDAGMTMDDWIGDSFFKDVEVNGNELKLAPIKSWREFDLNDPSQVKQFLAPGNFKLVSK